MLTFLVAALVAISGLGREATHPAALFLHRTLLFAIIVWCARDLYLRRSFSVSPSFLCLGGLCCLLMLSFLRNASFDEGFYFWYQFVLFALMFVVLAAQARNRSGSWKQRLLWIVASIQAVYLVAALVLEGRPIKGGFVNPNYFASFLLVGFSIGLAMTAFETHALKRALGFAASLFFFYGITQASSRGATLAALAVAVVAVVRFATRFSISRSWAAVILGALVVGGALVSPSLVRKFADRGQSDPYNYMRPQIWLGDLRLIADHPFFGVGLGQFLYVSRRYTAPLEGGLARYVTRPGIAHSEYLQYAAETGIPATLLIIGLSGYLIGLAIRRSRTVPPECRSTQEAAILVATGLSIHALVDNNWTVPVMAAGLSVFAMADVLPDREWKIDRAWTPFAKAVAAIVLVVVYAHSTLAPAAGLWFGVSGADAFVARDLKKAETDYRTATAILPSHPILLDNTGSLYMALYAQSPKTEWLDLAEEFFSRSIKANPDNEEPQRHLESVLIQRLNGTEADSAIHPRIAAIDREMLRVDPFNPFTRRNLAEALYRSGRSQEAEQELRHALEVEPNYVPGYLTLARWESERGNRQHAEQYEKQAMDILAKYKDVKNVEPYEALLLGRDPGLRR
jgi:O-antigen ligase